MTLTIDSPATIVDMAELCGARTPLAWAVSREMLAGGATWAARDGDRVLGIAGVYPVSEGVGELWFNARPELARHMAAIVRAARLTLPACGYREIVTLCVTGQGKRIASLLGMTFLQHTDFGELWTCSFSRATARKSRWKRSSGKALPSSPRSRPKPTRARP